MKELPHQAARLRLSVARRVYRLSGGSSFKFAMVLAFVVVCIALDGLEQVWVEWKRLLWGELGISVREKLAIVVRRIVSARTS
jgi:hypothetical protein